MAVLDSSPPWSAIQCANLLLRLRVQYGSLTYSLQITHLTSNKRDRSRGKLLRTLNFVRSNSVQYGSLTYSLRITHLTSNKRDRSRGKLLRTLNFVRSNNNGCTRRSRFFHDAIDFIATFCIKSSMRFIK